MADDLPTILRAMANRLDRGSDRETLQLAAEVIAQGDENQRVLLDLIGPGACANALWEEQPGLRQAYACAKARKTP